MLLSQEENTMPSLHSPVSFTRRFFLGGAAACGAMCLVPRVGLAAADTKQCYQQTALFMGTIVRIDIAQAVESQAQDAVEKAFAEGRRLEKLLTRFDASSPLGVLNTQGSLRDVPAPVQLLLDCSRDIYAVSEGAFDPTILPVLSALEEGRANKRRIPDAELIEREKYVGFERIDRRQGVHIATGMGITLDGIAKGWIAQRMSELLVAEGCVNHIVNAGGDISAKGVNAEGHPWQIAIEDPLLGGRYPSSVTVSNGVLATSGVYEQTFDNGGGSHLVIPRTRSVPDVVSASVLATDGALADALATALCVMEPSRALQLASHLSGVEACLVLKTGTLLMTKGWKA